MKSKPLRRRVEQLYAVTHNIDPDHARKILAQDKIKYETWKTMLEVCERLANK